MKKVIFTAFAVGLGLTASVFSQVPSYVPTNGLVGWWPFNGNANDESGNGMNGSVFGATLTTDRYGNSNSAYLFNGSSNVINCANGSNPLLIFNGSITISAWVNVSCFGCNNYANMILSKHSAGFNSNGYVFGFWNGFTNTGMINFEAPPTFDGSTFPAGQNGYINSNIWKNCIVVYDAISNSLKYYINGTLIDTISLSFNFGSNTVDLLIGAQRDGTTTGYQDFFNGKLDEIGLWNRALSQQEILDLYNSNPCPNLSISPVSNIQNIGGNATFTATTNPNTTYLWQSDFGQGFQTLNNYGNYSGATSNSLTISNVQLANHNQQIRAISTSGNCIDTSNIATIQIADTCITNVTVYDTLLTTVTDTLIINTTLSLPAPNNENTILIYPNPASDHITIDNGNFAAMAGYSIKIENNAGQQVFQSAINQQQFYVDLSTWTGNGLYFVHLIDPQNNTVTVRKIVLQ